MNKKKPFDKTEVYLRAAFRKVWRWSKTRRDCLKNANNKCELCKKKVKKLYADHIEPVCPIVGYKIIGYLTGSEPEDTTFFHIDYNQLFEHMFYGKLQAICKKCHSKKSKKENAERRRLKNE